MMKTKGLETKTKGKPATLHASSSQFQHQSLAPKFSALSLEQLAGGCREGRVSTEISPKLLSFHRFSLYPHGLSTARSESSVWAPWNIWLWCVLPLLFVTFFSLTPGSELCSAFPHPGFPCGKGWAVGSAVPCAGVSGTIHVHRENHREIPAPSHRGHLVACPVSAPGNLHPLYASKKETQNAVTCFWSSSQINAELYKLRVN